MNVQPLQTTIHADQRYLVAGLGLSGYSVARYLLQNGYHCEVQDNRQQPPYLESLRDQYPDIHVHQCELDAISADDFDCLVVSPGLSIRQPVMQQLAQSGKRLIGDIELFAEAVEKPVLAITGSNGKSTVTTLLGDMIRVSGAAVGVGGNIGVPALDLLEQAADFYVLELSSFQLETTHSLKPLVACLLNISEDHMDRYDDLEDYRRTKQSICHHAIHCVSNADDHLSRCSNQDHCFSLSDDTVSGYLQQSDDSWLVVNEDLRIATSSLKVRGRHNWANCLAAMVMADLAGIDYKAIISALKSFTGLPHRSEWVAEINGVSWINDSKATNVGAAKAAIEGMQEPIILIAGGQSKGASMEPLCESLKAGVKTVLLMGQDAEAMQQAWQDCVVVERVETMSQAVQRAAQIAQPGDVVLLSPACASFDMYSGFEARGRDFCECVRTML